MIFQVNVVDWLVPEGRCAFLLCFSLPLPVGSCQEEIKLGPRWPRVNRLRIFDLGRAEVYEGLLSYMQDEK